MKKTIVILLTLLMIFFSTSCGLTTFFGKIEVPDLKNVDEASAKTTITNKGLLPVIANEYSDNIVKGNVIRTVPEAGSKVKSDSKVTIYVSSGPRSIEAQKATIQWYHIDYSKPDEWHFYTPEIYEGDLYILCETTFGTTITLKGNGFGNASLTDSFDKYVPLTLLSKTKGSLPENKVIKAGEVFEFYIKISLAQLDSERPTHVACEIIYLEGGSQSTINVSFNISW